MEKHNLKGKLIPRDDKFPIIKLMLNETIIGRNDKFGITHTHISSQHIIITYNKVGNDTICKIKNTSRNGTWLNGKAMSKNEELTLNMFDEIEFIKMEGKSQFIYTYIDMEEIDKYHMNIFFIKYRI